VKVTATTLPGVLVIEPRVFSDARGFFVETFNEARFADHGLPVTFRQDNHSRSARNVLRGLHFQLNHPQGKLVTVARGEIFDAVVDIRVGSPTFGQWFGVTLRGDSAQQLWIPPGFAHGFCVLSDTADVVYKCTELYHADDDRGILWCDERIGIDWPIDAPILSARDQSHAPLSEDRTDLPRYTG
jgi:dTDP-4-dehydrorhamnose 3,5-epimerase